MTENLVRLNKAIADLGFCARRKADELIANGEVMVNDEPVIAAGHKINPLVDTIKINGKELKKEIQEKCHLVLNKPIHVVSTAKDPEGRSTVLDFVPRKYASRRLYPVGRLDYFSEGIILLTDDGELANKLAHPRYHLPRHYEVTVRGIMTNEKLKIMREGMRLSEGEQLAKVDVTAKKMGDKTILYMTLSQGLNRQIRRMCRDLNLTVIKLVRVGLGNLKLGNLKAGEVRSLTSSELADLREDR